MQLVVKPGMVQSHSLEQNLQFLDLVGVNAAVGSRRRNKLPCDDLSRLPWDIL
ncbi:hypothetical protein D9M68_174300 [compost metagenome]